MNRIIIIQARMNSTRLPGKVVKCVLNKPLLEYLIERLRRVTLADNFVIATTDNKSAIPIVELCKKHNVLYFQGDEDDVLSRYYYAAMAFNAETIIRITSDCPVIDPQIIDNTIQFYFDCAKADYVANWLYNKELNKVKHSYPLGMSVEVFSINALYKAFISAKTKQEREHVTPYIYLNPELFNIFNYVKDNVFKKYRFTVDTFEDFELIKKIIETLYPSNPEFDLQDIVNLMNIYPEWHNINSHIEQTKLKKI